MLFATCETIIILQRPFFISFNHVNSQKVPLGIAFPCPWQGFDKHSGNDCVRRKRLKAHLQTTGYRVHLVHTIVIPLNAWKRKPTAISVGLTEISLFIQYEGYMRRLTLIKLSLEEHTG